MVAPMIWDDKGFTQLTAFFPCDCASEGLVIMNVDTWDLEAEQGPMVSIAFMDITAKYAGTKMTWKYRLRYAWQCLRGRPFTDMVTLSRDTALAFAGTIIETLESVEADSEDK